MIDMQALLLDPVYASWGVPAVITTKGGDVLSCSVLDHRDGVNVTSARGGLSVLVPGATKEFAVVFVRCTECRDSPSGGTIVLRNEDVTYSIKSSKQKGAPGTGEWQLGLEIIR